MHQILLNVPIILVAAFGGALLATMALGGRTRKTLSAAALLGALLAGALAYSQWHWRMIPIRGYGVMILFGFLLGVWMAARRSRLIGVDPKHCVDVAIGGVFLGLAGARAFHVYMHWERFSPFTSEGFQFSPLVDMFRVWEGGLVFFGAFIVVVPWAYFYSRYHKLPALSFLDLAAPSLMAGLSLGRIGCFLNGCCYGKLSELPWAVSFPRATAELRGYTLPYDGQVLAGLLQGTEAYSHPVHPTQLYACLGAGLVALFLYALWPRRRFEGQILSLMLVLAGVSRFFEELLRADEPAAFPALSSWMTVAQWVSVCLLGLGLGLWIYFYRRHGGRGTDAPGA